MEDEAKSKLSKELAEDINKLTFDLACDYYKNYPPELAASAKIGLHEISHPPLVVVYFMGGMKVVPIKPEAMETPEGKTAIGCMINDMSKAFGVFAVIMISEGWLVVKQIENREQAQQVAESIHPEQDPTRQEVLIVSGLYPKGERSAAAHEIVRSEAQRPMLVRGDMIFSEPGAEAILGGRLFGGGLGAAAAPPAGTAKH